MCKYFPHLVVSSRDAAAKSCPGAGKGDDGPVRHAYFTGLFAGALVVAGCAAHPVREDPLVASARRKLGAPVADEPGFVASLLRGAGLLPPRPEPALPDAAELHAIAVVSGKLARSPRPGEVIFFADGPRAFHAGVVEHAGRGAPLTFLHAARGRVRRGQCDPDHPSLRRDGTGQVRNTYLRPRRPDDWPGEHYLCGQLLLDYADWRSR